MGCFKKKKAASSLAPSDKYHKNPQGGHRHIAHQSSSRGGGGEPSTPLNNSQFSHNGHTTATTVQLHPYPQDDDQVLVDSGVGSPYHFYPSSSVGSLSSSHQQQSHPQHHHTPAPPYLLYKSNQSCGSSGNGSQSIIEGSQANGGGVDLSSGAKYYYYNGLYYPTEEENPDQIFTITANPVQGRMGRVGEDMYPPGSPGGGGGGGVGSGLFKSKSGSLPVTSSPRGFRDTFISSMSPSAPAHAHSAESSPLHRSSSAVTGNDRYINASANGGGGGKQENSNKKWTFGGLFRRNKSKNAQQINHHHDSERFENGASVYSNSATNSPGKINNNYGVATLGGSSVVISESRASPAPSSSIGVISVDPSGHSETNYHRSNTNTTPKFVNAEVQTRAKGKLSESDISTCDSDFEQFPHQSHHDNPPEPAPQESKGGSGGGGYKQNFLVRRLSRRREKAAAKKKAALEAQAQVSTSASNLHNNNSSTNGFHSSHHHGGPSHLDHHHHPQMTRRVGSSPDSLNNSTSEQQSHIFPSWETTKKPQSQLHALQQHQQRLQNYSSNGSLSLSQEGSSNNTNHFSNGSRSSRAAAKDAVKARAIARRESFLRDSSSSGEEEDDDEDQRSRNSLQGSFSSLNSRNRRQKAFNMQQVQFQQQRHLFPATTTGASAGGAGGISCASPSSPMPVPLDYRNNMSPNMNRRLMTGGAAPPPASPKWEARLIYQQENITESNQPVVFRLPRKELQQRTQQPATTTTTTSQMSQNNGQDQSYIMATEMISEDQHVVTAGLKVPFVPSNPNSHQDQQCLMRNGQLMYQPDEPAQQYANVANGSRGRSATPFTTFPSNGNNPGPSPIHHASPTPPPPPRRDFSSSSRSSASNTNFYRPVSCSYLDAYASQLQNQHQQSQQLSEQQQLQLQMMRQQNPMIFNGNYIYPQQHQYQGQDVMNGFPSHGAGTRNVSSEAIRSSPRHLVAAASVHNANIISSASPSQEVNLHHRHPPLIRSPSEPPAIRVEQAQAVRNSTSSPRKRLTFSPTVGYEDDQGEGENKNVVTSKLGFPVRRLQDSSKLTGPQSPVHMKASEFWRKKESEVTGTSPVGNNQKKYLSRIRSADSSPLPVPKMRKSPGVIAASNESISSLSSFSENAASPGPPKNSSSPIHGKQKGVGGGASSGLVKVTPLRAQLSRTPNPQQLTYGNNNTDKENNNNSHQSAVERLKVRIPSAPDGIKTSSHPHPYHHPEHNNNSSNPIRALIDLNNGKTPGKNLEDALNELEDMYKSLRLSDEDLLDRAERRDLPTPHQELRDAPLIPIPQGYRFEHLGSVESLGTGSGSSGTNNTGEHRDVNRVRAPPMRRSSRPDTVSDDMANRRLAFPDGKPMDPRLMVAKAGSYIAKSPAFSPCTSPCPPDIHHMSSSSYPLAALFGQDEPDLTLDDVTFRNYKRANSIRIIEPQPPFGIPLGPITAAAATDYLHSEPNESYRPIFGNLKTPDVVNDDIAFRNLRKDLGQESGLSGTKDWTPRLFSPNRESSFNFPKVKDSKKLRAIRSLSANITHMMPTSGGGGGAGGVRGESPTSFYRDKWSSFSDIHRRASAGSPARASTYLQPSWVEQIEKVQTSTETLTDHRNSSGRLSSAILDPPEHWERKFPKKTVELTPPIYDPEKPRRPWTDIILESFEKEKEREMERIAAEAEAAAAAAAAADSNNTTEEQKSGELLEDEVGDDDVFMDASADEVGAGSKSEAAQQRRSKSEISGESNDPDGNGSSLQATPPNMEKAKSSAVIFPPRPLPLLPGQNTRRGSWVESSSSSSQSELQGNQSGGEGYFLDRRRKSWSDLPKDIDSFCSRGAITLSGQSSSSPTRKLFNPLPPPKKIRQINLGAFNNNSSSTNNSGGNDDDELTSSTTSPDKVKIRGEDELNELMDQLLKDADTCGRSTSPQPKSGHFEKSPEPAASVESSSHSTSSPPPVDVPCSEKEMKMDGIASSSSPSSSTTTPSCKQDLSCTIVGIIPKQQSPQKSPQQQEGNSSHPKRETSNSQLDQPTFSQEKQTTSTLSTTTAQLTSDKKGAGDSTSRKLFKIDNNGMGNVATSSLPSETSKKRTSPSSAEPLLLDVVGTNNRRKGEQSSIEDLIESINETLPELEAGIGITITKHRDEDEVDDDGKSNGSSSSSSVNGSPSSSIPSPHPSSPTPPRVLSVNVKKEVTDAFPVPAKRHHLPTGKGEESLYENLPVRKKKSTGNDVSSSSDPPCHLYQEQDPPTATTTKEIPPLDEEDNEHSSSHQPSSLSSNDSEVSGTIQREDEPNKANESVATHSSPPNSSSSFDNKPLTKTSSSSDAFPETKDDDERRAQAAKAALLRKKSEGYPPGNSIERVDQASRMLLSPRSSTKEEIISPPIPNGESCGKELAQRSASSSASPAPTEETPEKKKEGAPVAPPVPSTFSGRKCSGTAPSAADTSASETSTGMSFLRNNFPFFRNSTSRSRSQSVVSDISRSSETGDSKKEKDKSYRRKSHLNRAFTDEPVPDNGFPFDFTPKSSKPTSQEVSSLENSAVEEGRTHKPAVKLHPAIPPVLTATKSRSPSSKPVSRTNSINRNNEHTPSPTPTATCSSAAGNRKGTPVVKKDSFSDAEGVCFIKKMLQKESDRDRAAAALGGKQNSSGGPSASSCSSAAGYNLKKSPSAGNQSYWSKFSSSQSAFLRKLFDKPKTGGESSSQSAPKKDSSSAEEGHKQSGESPEKDSSEKENAEPMVGFSVAQKASFFMKLEHEQRFSKWRKNSVDLGSGAELEQQQQRQSAAQVSGSGAREFRPRSRYLTQPVTPTEVKEIAPLVNSFTPSLNSERDNQERILEFGSQPRIWSGKGFGNSMGNCVTDSHEKIKSGETSSKPTKSSYKDYDDTHKFEPTIVATSLKERVNKFDEIIIRKVAPIQVSAPSPSPNAKSYSLTRNNRNTSVQIDNLGGYPMYHSASAIINSTGPKNVPVLNVNKSSTNFYKNSATAYSSSSSSFSEAMSKNDSTKFLPLSASNLKHRNHQAIFENDKRCGSASDLELTGTANQSPVLTRSEKVQSMYLSRSGYRCDADNLSEDGEVSSGGQEVAEIICRSYENSPVFRKKNWRSQQKQSHSNFTKEIWRRCGNYENWNQTQRSSFTKPLQQRQQPQPQHPVPQTFTTTTNVIEVNTTAPITLIPVVASPPPATSNLLQILTVLSSSNDELSESKPNPTKSKKQRQGHKLVSSSSSSIPPVHPGHPSNNHSTATSSAEPKLNTATSPPKMPPSLPGSEIFVSVPHPEDEAFQSFFCSVKSYTQVTHYPGGGVNNGQVQQRFGTPAIVDEEGATSNNCTHQMPSTSSEGIDIGSVRRESDLLVMKKNMPTAKRKSNGKYKNPLRALAARMDFRQQGYTQIHNNTVQQSSDVDVTT